MRSEHERRGALEALDRVLNRGGDADDVLRAVVGVLSELYEYVGISFVEKGELVLGPSCGSRDEGVVGFPIVFDGTKVAELEIASPQPDERPFLERVALLISAYCLVGWDTGGKEWMP